MPRHTLTEIFVLLLGLICIMPVAMTQTQAPFISGLTPSSVVPGSVLATSTGLTVTVSGVGFNSASVVEWDGSPRSTRFVSSTKLTAVITAEDVESAGTGWVTVSVPGGLISNVAYFEVTNSTSSVSLASTDYAAGQTPYFLTTADFNGDGKLDLTIANYGGATISVLLGNGDGTFQAAANYNVGGVRAIAVGDFNGDGKLDLAVANLDNNNVGILLGNGDGTFQAEVTYPVGTAPISVATGDFNGDGKLDLAVANDGSNNVSVLLGNGDGSFQPAVNYAVGTTAAYVVLGDFNGDGKLDLAVANFGNASVSVLLGNGDGTFQTAVNYGVGNSPISLGAGDLNRDGKLDLVSVNADSDSVSVLLGNGNGTFQPAVNYGTGISCCSRNYGLMTLGDMNGDGKLDVAIALWNGNEISLLLGNGDGTFQAPTTYNAPGAPLSVAIGDFDGSGKMDLAVADHDSNDVSIFLQPIAISQSGTAQLNGGNIFTGDQTVNGMVTANSFVGSGSGLTGVTASGLNCAGCVGNSQLGIVYAAGDAQGGSALNALALGGLPVSAFAPAMGSPVYAPATGSAAYVAKGGDTMTGILNLPTDGLVAGGNEFVLTSGNVGVGTTTPENLPQYRSMQIDYSGAGFGGAFLELTHSTNGQKGRLVMDDHGFLLNAVSSAPIKIKAGSTFNGGSDPGNIYIAPSGNVGINTGTPAAALDVNGTANFSGLVTFAPGQTFPGSGGGTITGVTAGTGLSGGGSSGNVALTNTGLLSLAATNGILSSGGQNPTLSLNTSFTDSRYLQLAGGTLAGNLSAPAFVGSGAGLTNLNPANLSSGTANINITGLATSATNALNLGGNPPSSFATTGANIFGGTQTVNADANISGMLNLNGAFVSGLSGGLWTTGVRLNSTGVSTSTRGFPSGPLQFWASSFSTNTNGPWIQGFQWLAEPVANDTANPSASLNLQFINGPLLPPPPSGFTMQETGFSVSPQGGITIGGGNPIVRHTSTLFQNVAFNSKMSPATCTVWSGPMANLFDGDSVVVTLGSSLMTANIVYSAWATNGAVQVRICNPTGAPTTVGAGNIRVDVWRH